MGQLNIVRTKGQLPAFVKNIQCNYWALKSYWLNLWHKGALLQVKQGKRRKCHLQSKLPYFLEREKTGKSLVPGM